MGWMCLSAKCSCASPPGHLRETHLHSGSSPKPLQNELAAIVGILELMPLDAFVDQPVSHMGPMEDMHQVLEVHDAVRKVCSAAEGRPIISKPIERFAYYPIAEASFAVIQTAETRPYANFILKKGVV
jgi:L-fucose mutarotase